ncbi:hypothetical protein P4H61_11815 [Paenibacillus peoriae]|uniref:NADH-dependent flavin oxidoreductase n=1 Tax=Paenibacillus peoriae TaxID=59893 RepID=UPI00026C59ED|nr:NADH-dependent flavin oxidoreductase [Paenibacillus peoriae]MEC0182180.1 hypothetical protein [Paenibacillus peoriae]
MTRTGATSEGLATEQMISYYSSHLLVTNALYSQCYFNQPGIVNYKHIHGKRMWKLSIWKVRKIFVQIDHTGALSHGKRFVQGTIAPSALQSILLD